MPTPKKTSWLPWLVAVLAISGSVGSYLIKPLLASEFFTQAEGKALEMKVDINEGRLIKQETLTKRIFKSLERIETKVDDL